MAVAIGVRHFGDDGPKVALAIMTEPERDRVEDVAQEAGLGEEEDFLRPRSVEAGQRFADPGGAAPGPGGATIVKVAQGGKVAGVARKKGRTACGVGVQKDVIHGIAELVFQRPLAAMEGFAADMVHLTHAAACWEARAVRACAVSVAVAIPSSWKPLRIQAPQNQVFDAPFIAQMSFCA